MESEEERITGVLHEFAAGAGALTLRADDIVHTRRHRTRRRASLTAAATLAVCAVVGTTVAVGAGRTDGGEHPAARPSKTAEPDIVHGPLTFECGKPLPVRPVTALPGMSLRIVSVENDPPVWTTPEITYEIQTALPPNLGPTHVRGRALILRDSIIVGGPFVPTPPGAPAPMGKWTSFGPITDKPGQALNIVEQLPDTLCGTTTWSAIRADPARYRIAVVTTAYGETGKPAPDSPLLIAETGIGGH
ncbi:hypothetical protein B4N89_07380 [Embleya scabrispora]|uniref:Uncharacterized protein n=1 Tax=Embleya scabrispora TaxID=159449 RepID=A0A1T3NVB2_9ACTN|nr:hypothetical protein [Embleya scabrispora]OPC80797.1 hypothetical protein B4N89_07380 [Embleya scabrispora]